MTTLMLLWTNLATLNPLKNVLRAYTSKIEDIVNVLSDEVDSLKGTRRTCRVQKS